MGVFHIISKKHVWGLVLIVAVMALLCPVGAADAAIDDGAIDHNLIDDEVLTAEDTQPVSANHTPASGDDLQKCIDDAAEGDTIILNGTYYLKDTVNVDKKVNIVGSGQGALIKISDFNFYKIRYFNIASSDVVLSNLKFVDGQNQYGSAIYWSGDDGLILNCTFEGNIAVNDGAGGAVMVDGKNFRIENSTFTNNRATKGTAGAISINGDGAVVKNCIFEDNKVGNGSAGVIALFASNCLVENCNFTDNYCTDYGGAIVVSNRSNRIFNSVFKNNRVLNGLAQKGGGAIYSDCENLTVDNCTFEYNYADGAFGGAINAAGSTFVENSSFRNNHALLGNAIYASSSADVANSYFALAYNETELEAVHAADLTQSNNTYEVVKENSTVIFSAVMVFEYATSGSIYVSVEGGSIDLENISVIGHPEAKIGFNDNVLVVSNLDVGEYTLKVITTPDEAHNSVEKELAINVKKATAVIKATKLTVALKRGTLWTITVVDSKTKKPIANMQLTLKVYTNGKYKTATVKTNSKGIATYQTKNLAKGNHKIVVSAKHAGYNFNTLTSSINVIKPVKLSFKVKSSTKADGSRLSITVYKKSTKKPVNGVKIKLLIYTGKKVKTVVLKTKTHKGYKGVCGYGTNALSVGTHKVVLQPVDIKYSGSASSKMVIKKTAKKYPSWTKKITGK